MKKHLKLYIFILLLITLSVSLYSCKEKSEPVSSETVEPAEKAVSENTENNEKSEETEKNAKDPAAGSSEKPAGSSFKEQPKRVDVTGLPEIISTLNKDDGSKLVLVNKQYTVSSDYTPVDMVPVDGSLSTNQGLYFKREAYNAYLKMLADAKQQGISFIICSTYRSYQTQKEIYNGYVSRNGADYANTISAAPGRSEHHTGWAVDVTSAPMGYDLKQNFIEYPEGIWINNHCSEYGFIIRYPKDKTHITGYSYEPWHLRYVGVETAKGITSKGLTLEEYLGK